MRIPTGRQTTCSPTSLFSECLGYCGRRPLSRVVLAVSTSNICWLSHFFCKRCYQDYLTLCHTMSDVICFLTWWDTSLLWRMCNVNIWIKLPSQVSIKSPMSVIVRGSPVPSTPSSLDLSCKDFILWSAQENTVYATIWMCIARLGCVAPDI